MPDTEAASDPFAVVPDARIAPPAPEPRRRKAPPWWVWLIVGGVAAFLVMVVSGVAVFVNQLNKGYSPDYTGAPVEATEATARVVVSEDATVAYRIGPEWENARDFVDLGESESILLPGQSVTGLHYTTDPTLWTPQFVIVIESEPGREYVGPLKPATEDFLSGFRDSGAVFTDPEITPYTSPNGLRGFEAEFTASVSGMPVEAHIITVGNGERVVYVEWISYEGPVDEAALDTMMETFRIDR